MLDDLVRQFRRRFMTCANLVTKEAWPSLLRASDTLASNRLNTTPGLNHRLRDLIQILLSNITRLFVWRMRTTEQNIMTSIASQQRSRLSTSWQSWYLSQVAGCASAFLIRAAMTVVACFQIIQNSVERLRHRTVGTTFLD